MSRSVKTCFVIQCFDGDIYDRRYRETFAPAIEKAGAKPIRADEVLGTKPVVEKIEQGLRAADVAFAEVSENNANVFLELGYALALNVPTIIVCDRARRASLPFDIAHRPINFYSTSAQSDYEKIAHEVQKGIAAALLEQRISSAPSDRNVQAAANVDDVKNACLAALLTQTLRSPIGSALWEIQKEVSGDGITERMAALAIASLLDDNLIERKEVADSDGEWIAYLLSDQGRKHLLRSYSTIMEEEKGRAGRAQKTTLVNYDDLDDDIPF